MHSVQWLDIINFGLMVLIWLVQLIIYPSFASISRSEFSSWHRAYVRRISAVVTPLMLIQMLLALRLVYHVPSPQHFFMLACLAVIWISSFSLSVPCHKKLLQTGKDRAVIARLVRTNWIRTVLWTAVFLTGLA